jgi:hypothetical protein
LVAGVAGDSDDEAIISGLAGEIARLAVGEALTIAEFDPAKVTVWRVCPDRCGTPRIRYKSRTWDSLSRWGLLDEHELTALVRPVHDTGLVLARTGVRAAGFADGADDKHADRLLEVAADSYPHARRFHSQLPVGDLLDEATARVPLPSCVWYELVLLRRSRSGRLEFTSQQLFLPEARRGDTRSFIVRCEPGDEKGTVFAVAARNAAFEFNLISMRSAKITPGTYNVTATLLRCGSVRFDGLPVKLREETRSWSDVAAAVPDRFDIVAPAHVIFAVELCGSVEDVQARVDRVVQLISAIKDGADKPVRFSLLCYAAHSHDPRADDEPVRTLAWAETDSDVINRRLEWLRAYGPAESRYDRAAQIECLLADVVLRLHERKAVPTGRPALITLGRRPAFPHRVDPVSQIIPCPQRHDWRVLLRRLADSYPGMAFGAVRDGEADSSSLFEDPADVVWKHLGTNAYARIGETFDPRNLIAGMGLLNPAQHCLPFPLALS